MQRRVRRRDPGMRQQQFISVTKADDPLCSRNAAMANVRTLHLSVPVLSALVTTAGGVLFGAWVAI